VIVALLKRAVLAVERIAIAAERIADAAEAKPVKAPKP
jgi:hypothetical protein